MAPVIVRSEENYRTTIQIRDHIVVADEPLQDGGTDEGPTPLEIFVGTVGACIAVTTRAYARRKNWPLEGISVEVEMQRYKGEDYPGYSGEAPYVHEVREKIRFEGPLTDEQRERLRVIAGKCPVHIVLENPVIFAETTLETTTTTTA